MQDASDFSKVGFVRAVVLPVVLMILIPVVALWFSGHARDWYDQRAQADALRSLDRPRPSISEADRAELRRLYQEVPVSSACYSANPSLRAMTGDLADICFYQWQFSLIRQVATGCLVLAAVAFLISLLCVAAAFLSQSALYTGLVVGWNVLKLTSLVQTLGQGFLATMLSFWMTSFWLNFYFPKLIGIVGLVALGAVGLIVAAIFRRVDTTARAQGVVLPRSGAPALHDRIGELCHRIGAAPPMNVVAGIDDNFFVTESPLQVGERVCTGRTLFISLSLLRQLEREEADAIVAHEMAHFSGNDTAYSKEMLPVLTRYSHYLEALHVGVISRPIFYFMQFFWCLFLLALARVWRERELRADSIAAGTTSPENFGKALLKVTAYSRYRERIEKETFAGDVQDKVDLRARLGAGIESYASSPHFARDLRDPKYPHPFDSHPKLRDRLSNIKAGILPMRFAEVVTTPVKSSWIAEIKDADEIEQKLWTGYQEQFANAREEAVAYRYRPSNDAERAVVEKYFPKCSFPTKGGGAPVEVDHAGLRLPDGERVAFAAVEKYSSEERVFDGRYLIMHRSDAASGGKAKSELKVDDFADEELLLQTIELYAARDKVAREQQETRP